MSNASRVGVEKKVPGFFERIGEWALMLKARALVSAITGGCGLPCVTHIEAISKYRPDYTRCA